LLFAASSSAEGVYHDNVVIVLDASGSMDEQMSGTRVMKMDAAKSALKEVLRQVPDSTNIGLLVFSGKNVRNDWVYPLGSRDDAELMRAIDLPRPGGKTPLGAYIKKGADRLLAERAEQFGYGTYRLLIVTDGEAQDQQLVSRYTPEVIARGITVDVIGVDMKRAHTLATKVHSYRSANDPASLKTAVAEVFAEVGGSDSDAASEESFAALASIPDEVASAMLDALSGSGNHPIGERPKIKARAAERSARASRPTPSPVPTTPAKGNGGSHTGTIVLVIVAIGIAVIGTIAKKSRGRY
jgi:uncharacterized protein YegL